MSLPNQDTYPKGLVGRGALGCGGHVLRRKTFAAPRQPNTARSIAGASAPSAGSHVDRTALHQKASGTGLLPLEEKSMLLLIAIPESLHGRHGVSEGRSDGEHGRWPVAVAARWLSTTERCGGERPGADCLDVAPTLVARAKACPTRLLRHPGAPVARVSPSTRGLLPSTSTPQQEHPNQLPPGGGQSGSPGERTRRTGVVHEAASCAAPASSITVRSVEMECSVAAEVGETQPSTASRQEPWLASDGEAEPWNESASRRVSIESRNGIRTGRPVRVRSEKARTHCLRACSDVLISAPSRCRDLQWIAESAAHSDPAQSTRVRRPTSAGRLDRPKRTASAGAPKPGASVGAP
eukprot:scaffold8106_cov107-Isochrysis_galbana.AAC.14